MPKLKALLDSEFRDFKTKYDDLEIRGIYAIYEGDEVIYIGESRNIKDRLYNHLLKLKGNHNLRTEKLCGYKNLDTNEEILDFLLTKCRFKVIGEIYKDRLEKFAIGVINPKFNSERVRIKKWLRYPFNQ